MAAAPASAGAPPSLAPENAQICSELPLGAAADVEKSRAPEKPQKRGAVGATVVWIGRRAATVGAPPPSLAPENAQIGSAVPAEAVCRAGEAPPRKGARAGRLRPTASVAARRAGWALAMAFVIPGRNIVEKKGAVVGRACERVVCVLGHGGGGGGAGQGGCAAAGGTHGTKLVAWRTDAVEGGAPETAPQAARQAAPQAHLVA